MIDIIIPIYFGGKSPREKSIKEREFDLYRKLSLTKYGNVTTSLTRVVPHGGYQFSPGKERNNIVSYSQSDFIFFLDVDLLASQPLLEGISRDIEKLKDTNLGAFFMFPCLYLTKEETERFDGDFQGCLESFLRGENHRVEGIALASSCLLMSRE